MSQRARKQVGLGPFTGGINNVLEETSIPLDSLNSATNVDLEDDGKIVKRQGYEQKYSGTDIHSLYSYGNLCLFVEGGTLKRLNHDFSVSTVKAGLNSSTELSYVSTNGTIYYVSEGDRGLVSWDGTWDRWGIPAPKYNPILVAASGGMPAGEYQVAVTFQDASGRESGTPAASTITLTDNQKIVLTGIPTDTDSQYVKVYASNQNDTSLYHQMTLSAGTATADVEYNLNGNLLETQFLTEPPMGQFLEWYNGRMYVAQEEYLIFSKPYNYDLFDGSAVITFPEKIRFLKALNNGLFVGSDKIYFLRGNDPTELSQRVAYDCYPVYDTAIVVESTLFNFENIFGQAVFFWSDKGAMIGTEEGFVIPLSNRKYVPGLYDRGKSFFRQDNGMSSIVSSMTDNGGTSTLGADDSASATITRNGIVIG